MYATNATSNKDRNPSSVCKDHRTSNSCCSSQRLMHRPINFSFSQTFTNSLSTYICHHVWYISPRGLPSLFPMLAQMVQFCIIKTCTPLFSYKTVCFMELHSWYPAGAHLYGLFRLKWLLWLERHGFPK
jgi:hypothetical protein